MSRKGLAGGTGSLMDMLKDLDDDAMDEILATDDLSKVVDIMQRGKHDFAAPSSA